MSMMNIVVPTHFLSCDQHFLFFQNIVQFGNGDSPIVVSKGFIERDDNVPVNNSLLSSQGYTCIFFCSQLGSALQNLAFPLCVCANIMATSEDWHMLSVGQPHTEAGQKIVWQVSLARLGGAFTVMTDWRDTSSTYGRMVEAAFQEKIEQVTITEALLGTTDEANSEAESSGDWLINLEQMFQLNTKTQVSRAIRRCVITDPR